MKAILIISRIKKERQQDGDYIEITAEAMIFE